MTAATLEKLFKKNAALAGGLGGLLAMDARVSIQDAEGRLLRGRPPGEDAGRLPIFQEGQPIGWVSGGQNPAAWAELLTYAANQENEKKVLTAELLERYRELNLLYHLSESLTASPFPEVIGKAALAEAARMIPALAGMILLKQDGRVGLQKNAEWGGAYQPVFPCALVEQVLESGKAELANAFQGGDCFIETNGQTISTICAPLKTEKNILGVILLVDQADRFFVAGELKLLNTIAQQTAHAIEVSRLYLIELEKARYERDLQMARQVQVSLLPQQMPQIAGWQFGRRWHPAHDVSGDFYDVIQEAPQRLGLVIADITDKGMPASLFMVFVRSALRASITRSGTPARAIAHANRVICSDSYQGLFSTLFYARLNTASGELTYVNAGHPPALLYRAAQNEVQMLTNSGMALGVEIDVPYSDRSVQLERGDFIFFYTDGVIEAVNTQRKEFGLERLQSEVFERRSCSVEELMDGIDQVLADYIAPLEVEDDLTLMVVKRE